MNQLEKALSIAYAELYVRMEKALAYITQLEQKNKELEKKNEQPETTKAE